MRVSSDEEENTNGDGDTVDDIVMVSCNKVQLRKERDGNGNGRVYTINIGISDESGNIATAECYVTVPHNNRSDAVDDGVLYSIEGCEVDSPVPGFNVNDVENKKITPEEYSLDQNFPNPFNPRTKISYGIPEAGLVILKVYDLLGNEIAKLVNENKQAGRYEVEFNADNLASGVYIYRLSVNNFIRTKKMVLMR